MDGLLSVGSLSEDCLEIRLVDDGLEVTDCVGELGAESSVDSGSNGFLDNASDEDISEGDALADKECAGGKVGFEGVKGTSLALGEGGVCLDLGSTTD